MNPVGTYKVDGGTVEVVKGYKEDRYNYRYDYWPDGHWEREYTGDCIKQFIKNEGWIKQSQLPDKSDIED